MSRNAAVFVSLFVILVCFVGNPATGLSFSHSRHLSPSPSLLSSLLVLQFHFKFFSSMANTSDFDFLFIHFKFFSSMANTSDLIFFLFSFATAFHFSTYFFPFLKHLLLFLKIKLSVLCVIFSFKGKKRESSLHWIRSLSSSLFVFRFFFFFFIISVLHEILFHQRK